MFSIFLSDHKSTAHLSLEIRGPDFYMNLNPIPSYIIFFKKKQVYMVKMNEKGDGWCCRALFPFLQKRENG